MKEYVSERGSVVIIVVLAMVVLIGFTALAVDGGNLYFHKTRLQDIADSTALAAAIEIGETTSKNEDVKKKAAFNKALDYSPKNKLTVLTSNLGSYSATLEDNENEPGTMNVNFPDGVNEVKVDLKLDTNLFFAGIFGKTTIPINVSATARLDQASEETGRIMPLSFFWDTYQKNTFYQISLDPGNAQKGNFGYMDYEPADFKDYLFKGYPGTLTVGQEVPTYTGADVGQIDPAIEYRINKCLSEHTPVCTYDTVKTNHPDCPRLVVVPIIDGFFTSKGKSYVKIKGFAEFFIDSYKDKILSGYFLDAISLSEVSGRTSDFMLNSVHLVK